jgi:hypothetical protein
MYMSLFLRAGKLADFLGRALAQLTRILGCNFCKLGGVGRSLAESEKKPLGPDHRKLDNSILDLLASVGALKESTQVCRFKKSTLSNFF